MIPKYAIFLFFALLFLQNTEGVAQCACTDCRCTDSLELVRLYDASQGNQWLNTIQGKQKWKTAGSKIDDWYGVTTFEGRVISLDLNKDSLKGTIPNINLPKLRVLALQYNQLTGTIPYFKLPNLEILYLGFNQLSGTIPNFKSEDFPNLRELFIDNNRSIKGSIPKFDLPKLAVLGLNNDSLTGSIPDFKLPNIKSLGLHYNHLDGTIPNFKLPNLEELYLGFNQFIGTIPNFNSADFPNLRLLFIDNNPLLSGGIPEFDLPKLELLGLYGDSLTGTIPNFKLPNLRYLHLYYNKLSGNIPLFNSPNLVFIALGHNEITGSIPKFDLPNLELLDLSFNKLDGNVPNFDLPKLKQLHLAYNMLSGSVPKFELPNVERLYINNNKLDGIVAEMDLPKIRQLGLYVNKLTFSDILPNKKLLSRDSFYYAPQQPFTNDTTISVAPCSSLNIAITIDRDITNNVYSWFKNGKPLAIDSSHITNKNTGELTIKSCSEVDTGNYICKVTNSKAPNLTLESGKFKIEIDENAGLKIDPKEIYNGLTLNGDEENRYFKIKGIESCATNELRVYNKFGVEIYRKSPYDNKWDGIVNNQPLPEGTYYYLFYPTKGSKKPLRGTILILR